MALPEILKMSEKSAQTPVDVGSHLSVLQSIIHLGVQRTEYKGTVSYKDTSLFTFEIQDVDTPDGRPVLRSKQVSTSFHEKATLVKIAVAILGQAAVKDGISLSAQIGRPVMLNFKENEKGTGTTIESFSAVHKNLLSSVKPLVNDAKVYPNVDQISEKELAELPEFVQNMIAKRQPDDRSNEDVVPY